MKTNHKRDASPTSWQDIAFRILGGIVLSFGIALVSLLLASFAIAQGTIAQEQMEGVVLAVCLLSTLAGGLFVHSKIQKNGLLCGICVGLSFFLLLLALGTLFFSPSSFSSHDWQILFTCLVGGAIAKILRNKKKKY